MPGLYDWSINQPDFSDVIFHLRYLAGVVIDDMRKNVVDRRDLFGLSQKTNAPSTIRKKKHDHPLIGTERLFALRSGYEIVESGPEEVTIFLCQERADVAVYVENLGYIFFGISNRADRKIVNSWNRYIKAKVKDLFR